MKIVKGTSVQLKSGGPVMSAQYERWTDDKKNKVWLCQWFVNDNLQIGEFVVDSLKIVES